MSFGSRLNKLSPLTTGSLGFGVMLRFPVRMTAFTWSLIFIFSLNCAVFQTEQRERDHQLSLWSESQLFSALRAPRFYICCTIYHHHSLCHGDVRGSAAFFMKGFHPQTAHTHTHICVYIYAATRTSGLPDVSVRRWNDGNVALSVTAKHWGGRGMWWKTAGLHTNLHFWCQEPSCLGVCTVTQWEGRHVFTHCQHAESLLAVDTPEARLCDWECVWEWETELRFIGLKCSCRDGKFPFCPETETTAA